MTVSSTQGRSAATSAEWKRAKAAEDLDELHARVEDLKEDILSASGVPPEEPVLAALKEYETIAQSLTSKKHIPSTPKDSTASDGATSALLSSVNTKHGLSSISKEALLLYISESAYDILVHPPVFISPSILSTYTNLQSLLHEPTTFPTIFHLYANKPIPKPTSSGSGAIQYTPSKPNRPSAAIPIGPANTAVDAAIAAHDLPLALSIIDTTFCTPAWKKSKFIKSALLPMTGLIATPPFAYTLASRFGDWQNSMDPSTATGVAMAGILTYTSAVATVGYVAVTTGNDQMVRVTWATGMPLWERWVREEERAAVDRVAQAWGFRSVDRWGEEEGAEWEELKEWIGMRGMVLDRVELMEGME